MKIRIPKLTAEHFFGFFLALYWGQNILFSYARAIFLRIPYVKYFADYIIPCLMIVCLFLAIPYFAKTLCLNDILFASAVVVIFLLNIVIFPENESLIEIIGTFFVSVFPLYFIGLRFEPSKHFKILYTMSIINIWAFAAYYLLVGSSSLDGVQGEYGSFMGRAYVLLPQLLVTICGFLRKKNILNIATSIIGTILLLMCGNRGSVLILLLFVLFYLLFNTNKKRRVYVYVGAFSVFGFLAYYYDALIAIFTSLFSKLGMSLRIFEHLSAGTFMESSSREAILEKLKSAIWENPILGYGLCSDRTISGSYAHNYAFELWTAFGVIFGSIVLIATICVIVGAWIKSRDTERKGFLLVLISVGFLKLFLSSSFLLEGLFFMLIGYCVTQVRRNKFKTIERGCDKNESL